MAKQTFKEIFEKLDPRARDKLTGQITDYMRAASAGRALVVVSLVDTRLTALLKAGMPGLNKATEKELFGGSGNGLSTFSAKIHTARALALLEPAITVEMHKLRKLRNLFAHSDTVIDFENAEVRSHVAKFDRTGIPATAKPNTVFNRVVTKVLAAIESSRERLAAAKAEK